MKTHRTGQKDSASEFQKELDRLHAFYQKELSKKDKTISGLHRILDGHDRQIEQLQYAVDVAASFMDFLRKNTGYSDEWPIEIKAASDTVSELNERLNLFEKTVYGKRSMPVREVESVIP